MDLLVKPRGIYVYASIVMMEREPFAFASKMLSISVVGYLYERSIPVLDVVHLAQELTYSATLLESR